MSGNVSGEGARCGKEEEYNSHPLSFCLLWSA
jgi:hypothetical protein